jgi:hypothetical protein
LKIRLLRSTRCTNEQSKRCNCNKIRLHLAAVSSLPTLRFTSCTVADFAATIMTDSAFPSTLHARSDNEGNELRPEMFRRAFGCGHPEEFIQVRRDDEGNQIHNLITLEVFEDISRRFGSLPVYHQARCLNCAKAAKEQDDKNPERRLKRTLGTYQAVSSLTGFGGVLKRHRDSYDKDTVQPHRRVSEAEHHDHRLDMQEKAVECAGNWLAVPARRVRNMPIRTNGAVGPATRPQEPTYTNKSSETNRHANTVHFVSQCATRAMKGLAEISHGNLPTPQRTDGSFRTAAANTISSSASRLERQRRLAKIAKSDKLDLAATKSNGVLVDHVTEAHHPQDTPGVVSPGDLYEMERCNDYHGSPLEALSSLGLTSQKFEQPRPAPIVPSTPISPKKGALDFIRRRSSTSTRGPSRSPSMSMNFRKLGIDVHTARSTKQRDLDSDSPDWACQTSLAVEAGRVSMDSVSKRSWESKESKHTAEPTHDPVDRRNTYPSPAGDRSLTSPRCARHSEGAPRALRASAARKHEGLAGMEIPSPQKEFSRHGSTQSAPAVNLNKSLPALPPQDNGSRFQLKGQGSVPANVD